MGEHFLPCDNDRVRRSGARASLRKMWSVIIGLWLAGVLVAFFLIRILGSHLVQRIIERFGVRHG
jgi:hypothetical protein